MLTFWIDFLVSFVKTANIDLNKAISGLNVNNTVMLLLQSFVAFGDMRII